LDRGKKLMRRRSGSFDGNGELFACGGDLGKCGSDVDVE
jgi:hypothetical protein